jgi:hypothetical protein
MPGMTDHPRRFKDITSAVLVDQGGADQCSESRATSSRFAATAVLAERTEARLANGEEINIAEHGLLCSTLVRIAQRIGINRAAKNITPSLSEYLAQAHCADQAAQREQEAIEIKPDDLAKRLQERGLPANRGVAVGSFYRAIASI